ncbi:MAG: radical SAM protein [Gammaproteobacteria bacterium]|nr:radical SAM protein [Gammaproteobacteria bacterium]
MIIDRLGRQFKNLRVSLTSACNYACTYCVPDGKKLQPLSHELNGEELFHAVRLVVEGAGVNRLRITGGEPLLSKKFEEFLRGVMSLGLDDVGITTNGQLLPRYMPVIRETGLKRINISLDTLDASKFRSIARSGDLATVQKGIEMSLDAGMRVKINTVPVRSGNENQILPLLDYSLDRQIELRYIELMNMGHLKYSNLYAQEYIGMKEILSIIQEKYEIRPANAPVDSTSIRYEIPGRGFFGIIANESEPFCRTCSRLRISSNGDLYGCLSNSSHYALRPLLALPLDLALQKLQPILRNAMADKQSVAFTGETTVMKFIGG